MEIYIVAFGLGIILILVGWIMSRIYYMTVWSKQDLKEGDECYTYISQCDVPVIIEGEIKKIDRRDYTIAIYIGNWWYYTITRDITQIARTKDIIKKSLSNYISSL